MISEEGRIRKEGQRDHNLLAHNVYVRLLEMQRLNQVNDLAFASIVEATMKSKSTQGSF